MATFADNSVANFFFTRHGNQNGRSLERWCVLHVVFYHKEKHLTFMHNVYEMHCLPNI